jgi:hypothetical protein
MSTDPSQTTTTNLTPEQQRLQRLALPLLQKASRVKPAPTQSFVAPTDALQTQGQQQILNTAAPQQQQLADQAAQQAQFLSGDVLHPGSNPALQEYINAATQPIEDTLLTQTLPAIRGGANQAGQFGGSRQGIAEGLASKGASQAIGATSANIANAGYGAGLDASVKNLALTPQTQATQTAPGLSVSGVGDVRQAQNQASLSEQIAKWNYNQSAPLAVGSQIASVAAGLPGGSTTTTATTPEQDPLMRGLGLAAAGASILPQLMAFL